MDLRTVMKQKWIIVGKSELKSQGKIFGGTRYTQKNIKLYSKFKNIFSLFELDLSKFWHFWSTTWFLRIGKILNWNNNILSKKIIFEIIFGVNTVNVTRVYVYYLKQCFFQVCRQIFSLVTLTHFYQLLSIFFWKMRNTGNVVWRSPVVGGWQRCDCSQNIVIKSRNISF